MLARVGIDRKDCYLTNVMKIRPPNNDFGQFYLDPRRQQPRTELTLAIEELKQEILRIKPNIVVPLGSEPLRAITGKRSIDSWRGSILSSPVGKVVGTYHPAYILRQYGDKPIVELDLKRIKLESSSPEVRVPKAEFLLDPSFDLVMDWLTKIRPGDRLAFDIETVGPIIRCLGLSKEKNKAICIPFMSSPFRFTPNSGNLFLGENETNTGDLNNHYREEEEYQILKELDRVFSNQEIHKIAQNAPFDIGHLAKQFGIICNGLHMDTMVAWHTLYPELPKGLDFLCSILTRVPYYSDHDVSCDYEEWTYNCWDAAVTWEISYHIEKELQTNGLLEFFDNHVKPTLFAVTRAENRGILIDEVARSKKRLEVENNVERIKLQIQNAAREFERRSGKTLWLPKGKTEFNPNSPPQLQSLLYDVLQLPVQYSHARKADGSRSITTDKNSRDQLAKRFPEHAPILRLIDDFSKEETLLTGFLNRPVRDDGRMYTHLNVAGTRTGRLSSSDPIIEAGTNLQNIPIREYPEFRGIFIADKGWTWIKADLKAAEYMVVMWGANVQRVIQRFNDPNFDPHRWAASQVFGVPEESVSKDQRSKAKNGNYGGNYGMSAPRASIVWKVPETEAAFTLNAYHKIMPEIRNTFWFMIQEEIKKTRTIISPFGRKRTFFGRLEDGPQAELFREAYSHYAQNIVADVINRAMGLIDDVVPEDECHIILQVHDEIDLLCRTELLNTYLPLIQRLMEYPITFPGVPQQLTIPAELSYGPDWYRQTKWNNKPIDILQHIGEVYV